MYFKERFEGTSFFQKIEIVLIVVMIYGGILYYIDSFISLESDIKEYKKSKQHIDISQKIDLIDQNRALQFVQQSLLRIQIENSSVVVENKKLSLQSTTTYQKALDLIAILEKHFLIESLSIVPKDQFLKIQISLDTKYLFNQNEQAKKITNLVDPFFYETRAKEKKEDHFIVPIFQVDAILDKEVLINQTWYQQGESIQNNTIIKIQKDKVLFENDINQKRFSIKYKN